MAGITGKFVLGTSRIDIERKIKEEEIRQIVRKRKERGSKVEQ